MLRSSQTLKAEHNDGLTDEDYSVNNNISVSLSAEQINTQAGLKFFKSNLANSKKLTKSKIYAMDDDNDIQQNILKQHFTRLETTSTNMPILKQCEHYPEVNTLEDDTHLQITSIDGFFNRKRGRPPKNRFVELYKNTHPKPQAIFTSFKLEKLEPNEAETPEKSPNIYFYTDLQTLRDCENAERKTSDYSGHKPISKNVLQHKRALDTMNNYSPPISMTNGEFVQSRNRKLFETKVQRYHDTNKNTSFNNSRNLGVQHNIENNIPKSTCKNWTKPKASTALEVQTSVAEESNSTNSLPCYNHKFCGATENITVVRAAGTYYPENSNDNTKLTDFVWKKMQDEPKLKRVPLSFADELQYRENLKGNAKPQDLRIKHTNYKEKPYKQSSSSSSSLSLSNFVLSQFCISLQMQQQFLAFWQQMILMTPIFSYLDMKSFANKPDSFMHANERDGEQKLNFLNMLPNQMNQDQYINVKGKYPMCESERQAEKPTKHTTTTTTREMLAIRHDTTNASTITSTKQEMYKNRDRTLHDYKRFRSNDDCGFDKCGYRQHQSHFHCNRLDCQFGFCDKTRFVQHSTRHKRLDNLMGSDFQQFSAKISCHIDNCQYNYMAGLSQALSTCKSTHFHCLKCQFVSADSGKIVAHRRLHNKNEFIRLAGFRKVSSKENCSNTYNTESQTTDSPNKTNETADGFISSRIINTIHHCPYSRRHAHYHCLTCNASVLLRSHLKAHKHRSHSTTETPTIL